MPGVFFRDFNFSFACRLTISFIRAFVRNKEIYRLVFQRYAVFVCWWWGRGSTWRRLYDVGVGGMPSLLPDWVAVFDGIRVVD